MDAFYSLLHKFFGALQVSATLTALLNFARGLLYFFIEKSLQTVLVFYVIKVVLKFKSGIIRDFLVCQPLGKLDMDQSFPTPMETQGFFLHIQRNHLIPFRDPRLGNGIAVCTRIPKLELFRAVWGKRRFMICSTCAKMRVR